MGRYARQTIANENVNPSPISKVDSQRMTGRQGISAAGEIAGSPRHLISAAGDGARVGMAVSEYLPREKLRRGESFSGAIHGKYADEY